MRIEAVAGKPVELPSGDFVANAEMTRSGTDLHLTTPDGHTVIVEGYFAQQNPPDLVTHDGARLTSSMVDAFVPPEHVGQYAASGQSANDSSPAGRITQEVGDAFIIHADGTKVAATVGSPIYQGDVIETSKTGAVNIQFADNTTFAISENARMSVDQFVYHSADHSGSTFFSMLQGMFVYTSGLIGKTDPGSVSIETPVGSIGIRGTVVAGHILPAGQQSQITIVDGAVTVTNGSGTQDLNTSFATVSMSSYQAAPASVPMDAHTFNNSYHAISSVASDSLGHFTGMTAPAPAGEHAPAPAGEAAPAGEPAPAGKEAPAHSGAPAGAPAPAAAPEGAPAPTGSAAPAAADSSTTQASTTTTAPAAMTLAPTIVTAPPPPSSSGTSSFGSTSSSTFGSTGTATTFSAPATTGSNSNTGTAAAAAPPPPPPTTTAGTTTSTTTTAGPPPVLFSLHATDTTNGTTVGINVPIVYTVTFTAPVSGTLSPSSFSNHGTANVTVQSVVASTTIPNQYTVTVVPTSLGTLQMGASGITSVGGAQLTNAIQSTMETVTHDMNIQWGAAYLKGTTTTADDGIHSFLQNGSVIGHLASVPGASIGSYTITVTSAGQEYNFSGYAQSIASPGSVFTINTNGDIVVNDYLALSSLLNPSGLNISINAYSGTSGSGTLLDTINGVVQLDSYPTNGASTMQPTIFTGNPTGSTSTSNYMITTGNNAYMTGGSAADILVIAGSGDATIIGGGGADIIIGGTGNDWINVSDGNFLAIDGGSGYNRIQMSGNGTSVDFTALGSMFRNISEIDLGQASTGNHVGVTLNAQNIFDMTNAVTGGGAAIDVLNIKAVSGSTQDYVDISGGGFTLTSGIWGVSPTLTYTGQAANGSLVTLNIAQYENLNPNVEDSLGGAGTVFVKDSNHILAPYYETQTSYTADVTHKFLVGTASFGQTLIDGGQSGVILIGNSTGQSNHFYISNTDFSFIDGGAEATLYGGVGHTVMLNATGTPFTLDFAGLTGTPTTGTMRNIDNINLLGTAAGNGNSITLDIQDVFNMTNAADNYTLHISNSASNSNSLASVTVITNSSGFHNTIGSTLGTVTGLVAPGTAEYQGTYQGHNVTLVIDNATSLSAPLLLVGSTAIHVATHP